MATDILSYGDAESSDISAGKTALVKGKKVTGTMTNGIQRTEIGSFNAAVKVSNRTFSAKSIENYQNLTIENFSFIPNQIWAHGGIQNSPGQDTISGSTSISMSYDATTGTLTISNVSYSASKWSNNVYKVAAAAIGGTVYCYH